MPYVKQEQREDLDSQIDALVAFIKADPKTLNGRLNYTITRIVSGVCSTAGRWSYDKLMAAIGAFECAKLELYRRVGGPKEEISVYENGDTPEYSQWRDRLTWRKFD